MKQLTNEMNKATVNRVTIGKIPLQACASRYSALILVAVMLLSPGLVLTGASDDLSVPVYSADAGPIQFYEYRNFSTIRDILLDVEATYPGIAKVYDIGDSWESTQGLATRDILAIKISDNVLVDEDEPEVLIVALHHAGEWVTSELVTEAIMNITSSYGNDTRISWLVDNRELWIVPVVNPDGLEYALTVDSSWRKNRRLNYDGSYGVDLNRNYNGSENGDPAGAWGGVDASDIPSYPTYCGEAPFSEPETVAIRDLTYARDFQIELDFHSSGEWVMWPWGYTSNLTDDDASLVSIGNQLAALNGYTAAQSVDLYPTTGDTLDWLYGGADVYPFLFEIGTVFQPKKNSEVWGIIDENMPALMLGIEIAGDRDMRAFDISHSPVSTRAWSASGHSLEAVVTAGRGVDTTATTLVYRADGGSWTELAMDRLGNDTYAAVVPAQSEGTLVEYYFVAHDLGGVEKMSPTYSPYEVYSFTVTPASYGMLRAVTNPAVPGMIYIDGQWMSRWGLDWVKLSPGEYTLSFGDVLGLVTPEPQMITIVAGEITYAQGDYVAMGSLRVITEPAVPSTIYVDGIPRNDWGFWNYVPAGTYTVSFGAVADMATPSPQTVTVTEGGFQQVTGTFISSPGAPGPDPASYGMLRLTSSPAVPLDGEWMSHWGLDWVKLAPGEYTLSFSDVFGALTPAPETITITAGMTTTYEAVFDLAGTLRVMTSPPVPSTVYVDGIPRNDWGLWVDVPVGTYVISFGDVEGLTTPEPQTVTVTAGGYTEVTGVFAWDFYPPPLLLHALPRTVNT